MRKRTRADFNESGLSNLQKAGLAEDAARKARTRARIQRGIARFIAHGGVIRRLPAEVVTRGNPAFPQAGSSAFENLFGLWHGALEVVLPED